MFIILKTNYFHVSLELTLSSLQAKNYYVKIVILEVYAFYVLQCTVVGLKSKHKTDGTA